MFYANESKTNYMLENFIEYYFFKKIEIYFVFWLKIDFSKSCALRKVSIIQSMIWKKTWYFVNYYSVFLLFPSFFGSYCLLSDE